jgi:catechol 2,3-dioxygenase-like lactoylglutathione lyase family enzyme
MFARVTVTVSDLGAGRRFYETLFATLARDAWDAFAVDEGPPTQGLHVAFAAGSREEVDAFWRAGVDAGYPSDGEPGLRPQYRPDYYGAFLRDPDGNSVEAVNRPGRTETGPSVDHLWLGVSDLEASRRFWEGLAPPLGLQVEAARFEAMVAVAASRRHLMLVADGRPPTSGVRIALAAAAPVAAVTDPDGNAVEGLETA